MTQRTQVANRIVSAMDDAAATPMQWGVDDCALWVANILQPVVGYDPAAAVRGRYRSRRGSMRITGREGLIGQLRSMAKRRKWKRIDPALAQSGDVGLAWTLLDGKAVLATMICRDRDWFVGRSERGFSAIPAGRIAIVVNLAGRIAVRSWSAREPVQITRWSCGRADR